MAEEYEYNNEPQMANEDLMELTNEEIDGMIESGTLTEEMSERLVRLGKLTQNQLNTKIAAQAAAMNAEEAQREQAAKNAKAAENVAKRRRDASSKIGTFIKRRNPMLQRKIATRKAANVERRKAQEKARNVLLNEAKAATRRAGVEGSIIVLPPNIPNNLLPGDVQFFFNSHENAVRATKRQALQNNSNALLAALRTNTNLSAANWIRQIPSIPKHARSTYVVLAKLDDIYGKLGRNLSIAETDAERKRIAEKKYNVGELRRKVRSVMDKQTPDPNFPFPPGLQREVNAVIAGENVGAVLAPMLPVANRLPPAIAAFEAAKEARYATLKNQMRAMTNNSKGREKLVLLAAVEEAIETVNAQPLTSQSEAAIAAELAALNVLRGKIEQAIADNTPVDLLDKSKIIRAISDYVLEAKRTNGLYKRLKENRNVFNTENFAAKQAAQPQGMIPINAVAAPVAVAVAQPSQAERRRLAAEAAAKRFAKPGPGGKRNGRKTRRQRKN